MQDDPQIPQLPIPENINDIWHWVLYIGGALVTALVFMWKLNESKNSKLLEAEIQRREKLEQRLDRIDAAREECEKDRQRLEGVCGELRRRIDALEKP